MGRIVVGIASSHTPQLSSGVDMWEDHAERDRKNARLLGPDAEYHTYDELVEMADPKISEELARPVWEEKDRRSQDAVAELARQLGEARPDIAVVIGDDQRELFRDEGIPSFAFFLGEELYDRPLTAEQRERMPKGIVAASWAAHAEEPQSHLTSADLSRHVVDALVAADFDVTVFSQQVEGRSLGHAFTFPRYRLGLPPETPIVPVFVNTYYPPNVPSARRCYQLGQRVGEAVRSWPGEARVAIVASGGLSHFVVDENLDRRFLTALTTNDAGVLCSLSRKQLRSGTSELLNWVVAAGALQDLQAKVIDYVPGYRSPAATGCGMAFVAWS
jgi:hypothetical protein